MKVVSTVLLTLVMLLVSFAAGAGILLGGVGLVTGVFWPLIDKPEPIDFVVGDAADQPPALVRVGERVQLRFYEDVSVNGLW